MSEFTIDSLEPTEKVARLQDRIDVLERERDELRGVVRYNETAARASFDRAATAEAQTFAALQDRDDVAVALDVIRNERDALREALMDLEAGKTAILPHTKEHALRLYTVAIAFLKTYGIDPEAKP